MSDNKVLSLKRVYDAKKELKKFLDENPEAREFQKLVEIELNKAGENPINRLVIINKMMSESMLKLKSKLLEVKLLIENKKNTSGD